MKTMKKIVTLSIAILLLAAFGMNTSFAAKPTGGGKGGKVKVESASPSSVIQTFGVDVTILGAGFDNGSSVRFLVAGTDDDEQIGVGPVQFINSTELRVRIETTGSTATVDYDIEVETFSGRKGKGTTLFKVEQSPSSCPDNYPEFAYLHDSGSSLQIWFSSLDGCYKVPVVTDTTGLKQFRLSIRGGVGVLAWRIYDSLKEHHVILGLFFDIDSSGFTPDPAGTQLLYSPAPGFDVLSVDVRLDSSNSVWLVVEEVERSPALDPRSILMVNVSQNTVETLSSGVCQIEDSNGECFEPKGDIILTPDGTGIYYRIRNQFTGQDKTAIARRMMVAGLWEPPEIIIQSSNGLGNPRLSAGGMLLYDYPGTEKIKGKYPNKLGIVDPDSCRPVACSPEDGDHGVNRFVRSAAWTSQDTVLFTPYQWPTEIRHYIDPINGIEGELRLRNARNAESGL